MSSHVSSSNCNLHPNVKKTDLARFILHVSCQMSSWLIYSLSTLHVNIGSVQYLVARVQFRLESEAVSLLHFRKFIVIDQLQLFAMDDLRIPLPFPGVI